MALPALLGAGLKSMGGGLVKGAAKGAATNFIKGKKTKVKPEAVKGGGEEEKKSGALAIRPKTSMVPGALAPIPAPIQEPTSSEPAGEKTEQDTILIIKEKVIQIQNILKGTLAADKARSKAERVGLEKQKRKKQETALEKSVPNKDKKAGKKFNVPGKGLLSGVFDFFKNLFLGWLLIKLVNTKLPGGQSLLAFIGGSIDFITDLVLGVLDAAGTFLLWGKKAYEGTKGFIEDKFGEGAGEAFEDLMTNLNKVFNLISILALGIAAFNPFEGLGKDKKKKVKLDKRGRDVNKRKQIKKDFDKIRKENPKLSRKEALARAERKNRDVAKRNKTKQEYDKIRKDNPKLSKSDALKKATEAVDAPPKKRGGIFGFFDSAGEAIGSGLKKTGDVIGSGFKAVGSGLNYLSGGNLGKLGNFLQDQYKNASEFARKQYDKVVAVGQKLKSKFNSAAESAKGALQKLGEAAQKKILQPILDKLKPFTDPIIEMAKKLQGVIMDNLKKIPGFDNILQVLKKKGINSLGDVGNIAKKVGGKALPVVGGIFNLMFAYDRLANGDTIGALLETLSAGFDLAGLLPGGQFGPPISMGIDAYMFARDFVPAIQETEDKVVNGMGLGTLKSNLDKAASSLPDLGSLVKMFTGGDKKNETGGGQTQQQGGSASDNTGSATPVKTGDLDPNSGASNVSGEAGKFIEQNLESAAVAADGYGDYNRITEHPDFGGVRGRHATGSYHYSGRAIDIGAFTNEQAPIVDVINQFNQKKGVQPAELITGASFPGTTMVDPGGHGDHVHLAYGLGGLVKGITHAMLGEKGKEYVVDNDSYTAIEGAFPGLFDAINKAKGDGAVEALMAYTDYEKPQAPQMQMVAAESAPGYSGGDEGGSTTDTLAPANQAGGSSYKDILYKFG